MNIAYMPNKYYTFATDVKAAERRMIMEIVYGDIKEYCKDSGFYCYIEK